MIRKQFDEIPVSTKTFIVMTNLTLDIANIYETLPITDYIVVQKKRGRKKKNALPDPNADLATGSIITLEYLGQIRGVILKKKKSTDGNTYFRNSVTVVMIVDGKKINFKMSKNGKFQMTGCKSDSHAEKCVKGIWNLIRSDTSLYTLPDPKDPTKRCKDPTGVPLTMIFIPAMRNIDFGLGFCVDREALDEYFNSYTKYCSLLETSIGYTGVNIKGPVSKNITDLMLKRVECKNDRIISMDIAQPDSDIRTEINYVDYLNLLPPKDKVKQLKKERYNTFLVFHSGKVIMSSLCEDFARDEYYNFLDIINKNRDQFEEKLIE
jgi:TATA-box binding protein (TBP) (component of TFIID and TFIIIB)